MYWEYNDFDARKKQADVHDFYGLPFPESPTDSGLQSTWKNKWKKDGTIQITCSGRKYNSTIISYPRHSNRKLITNFILRDFTLIILLAEDEGMNPCKCNSFVDGIGFGLCRKRDIRFSGSYSCFVDHPSSCIDAIPISKDNAKYMSAIACEDKNEGTKTTIFHDL